MSDLLNTKKSSVKLLGQLEPHFERNGDGILPQKNFNLIQ